VIDEHEARQDGARELAAAERVAGAMLHEVRNVLNPIVSAAFLLDANAGDPAKVRELARRIEGFAKAEERVAAKMRELLAIEARRAQDLSVAGVSGATTPSSTSVPTP
jgi:signal transduction histidine kinase